jgi:hypothetical protein
VNVVASRDFGPAVPQQGLDNLHVFGGVIHPRAEAVARRMEPKPLAGLDDTATTAAGLRQQQLTICPVRGLLPFSLTLANK